MEGPLDRRPDPAMMRISDADRHQVAEILRQAAGEGRIDIEELDERLEATYQAKTYGELVPITLDLPTAGGPPRPKPVPRPATPVPLGPGARYPGSLAVMSETKRLGSWVLQDGHSAVAVMGSVVLDLREAQFEDVEVTINASAIMGEVKVIVNSGTRVVVDGVGLMGEFTEQRAKVPFDPERGGPVVRVRGFALMGSVNVQRKGPPGEPLLKRLGWHGG
jgi:Domain of unknown function (DUF1707)